MNITEFCIHASAFKQTKVIFLVYRMPGLFIILLSNRSLLLKNVAKGML